MHGQAISETIVGHHNTNQETAVAKDFNRMEDSNTSANQSIHQVSDPARRQWVQGSLGMTLTGLFGSGSMLGLAASAGCAATAGGDPGADFRIGFTSIPVTSGDTLVVPQGYEATAFAPWGEPVGIAGNSPAWRDDGSNSAQDQEAQMGMHHDGLEFFPLEGSRRGLLVMNHEYADDGLLHPDGMKTWSAEKVRKSQAAHGISIIEISVIDGRWQMVRPSRYARRLTAYSPFELGGPAAGHRLLQTAADPQGRAGAGHAQ